MQEHPFWHSWAQFLQHWEIDEPAAALLDGLGPVSIVLAQFLYAGQPFLGGVLPEGQWNALARLLESQEESRTFAAFLRREDDQ